MIRRSTKSLPFCATNSIPRKAMEDDQVIVNEDNKRILAKLDEIEESNRRYTSSSVNEEDE